MTGFRSSFRDLIGRGSVYAVGRAGIVGGQLLVLPIVTRILSPEEFGVVALAFIVSSLVASFGDFGLPQASARVLYDEEGTEGARRLNGALLLLAGIVVLAVHSSGPVWSRLLRDIGYAEPLVFATWMAWPAMVRNATLFQLRAADRAIAHNVVALSSALGGQMIGLALLLSGPPVAARYVLGVAIGATASAVIGVGLVGMRFPRRTDGALLSGSLRYSLPTVPRSVSQTVLASGDRYVIERLMDLASVGQYQVGYRVGSVGLMASTEISRAAFPVLLGGSGGEKMRARRTLMWFAIAAGGSVALLSPWAIRFVAPPAYQSDSLVWVATLVSSAAVPAVIGATAATALVSSKRTGLLAIVAPIAALVGLGGAAIGVTVAGLPGSAAATLLAYVLQGVALEGGVSRIDPVSSLPPFDRMLGAGASVVIAATGLIPSSGGVALVRPAFAVALLVAVGWGVVRR